jgi:mRNA-degrading endonuclease toxin of MazEF toxin-antitoxin module
LPIPARGDIYHIEIADGEKVGHELSGGHWWVVLSVTQLNTHLHLFTAVPLTSVINKETGRPKDDGDFRFFRIRVLSSYKSRDPGRTDKIFDADSIALVEQLRTFSDFRIKEPRAGTVDDDGLAAIEGGLLFVIGAGIHRQKSVELSARAAPRSAINIPKEPPKPLPGKPFTSKA